jgi:hypothetical protein
MSYIDGIELAPNKSLYYNIEVKTDKNNKEISRSYSNPLSLELGVKYSDKLSKFSCNNKKALSALKSIISLNNNNRFKDKLIAEELYKAIITTYSQFSFKLISRYFNKIIDTNYNSFNNINKYTSNI